MLIRPISVMRADNISDQDFGYVVSAIKAFLNFFNLTDKISVVESGMVFESGKKVEDYLVRAKVPDLEGEMIDGWALDNLILGGAHDLRPSEEALLPYLPSYLITVVDCNLRWHLKDLRVINGLSSPASSAIISVRSGPNTKVENLEERIKMTTMHELGHMFGLIPSCRPAEVDINYWHCTNWCIMRRSSLPLVGVSGVLADRYIPLRFCSQCCDCLRWIINGGEISSTEPS